MTGKRCFRICCDAAARQNVEMNKTSSSEIVLRVIQLDARVATNGSVYCRFSVNIDKTYHSVSQSRGRVGAVRIVTALMKNYDL